MDRRIVVYVDGVQVAEAPTPAEWIAAGSYSTVVLRPDPTLFRAHSDVRIEPGSRIEISVVGGR